MHDLRSKLIDLGGSYESVQDSIRTCVISLLDYIVDLEVYSSI